MIFLQFGHSFPRETVQENPVNRKSASTKKQNKKKTLVEGWKKNRGFCDLRLSGLGERVPVVISDSWASVIVALAPHG